MKWGCLFGGQFQGSEQQIGIEQWEECGWLFRNLAVIGKETEGGAQRGWTSKHGWKAERTLPAERKVSKLMMLAEIAHSRGKRSWISLFKRQHVRLGEDPDVSPGSTTTSSVTPTAWVLLLVKWGHSAYHEALGIKWRSGWEGVWHSAWSSNSRKERWIESKGWRFEGQDAVWAHSLGT